MVKISTDTSTKVDITTKVGDSFYIKATLTDDSDTILNVPSFFGSDYVATLSVVNSSGEIALGFSSGTAEGVFLSNSIVVDETLGTLTVSASGTQMGLRANSFKYFLVISGSNATTTVFNGKLKVK
tara:strand:+ start:10814 stop:11191 length:378 start_codon:yes stop_codon:yes gene_type:complete